MNYRSITILMYTFGTGSGHLSRVNAILKGFLRNNLEVHFYVFAPRSKYLRYLHPQSEVVTIDNLPQHVDIFICDWKSDDFVDSLPTNFATIWVGLRRLGEIRSTFPSRFFVVAIEPEVEGDVLIWPIISTWRDELVTEIEFREITNTTTEQNVALLCENGSYASHPKMILQKHFLMNGMVMIKCSNSQFASAYRDLDYSPIARLFSRAKHIVVGAGYNSIHECLCFSEPSRFTAIRVGGDDQEKRLRFYLDWVEQCPGDSQSHTLASKLIKMLLK